jgi:hypothetical protein
MQARLARVDPQGQLVLPEPKLMLMHAGITSA